VESGTARFTASSPRRAVGSGGGMGDRSVYRGRVTDSRRPRDRRRARRLRRRPSGSAGAHLVRRRRLAGEAGRVWPVDDAPAELHQTWGWDSVSECWRVDVFREPWERDTWVCRRDLSIRRPLASMIERDPTGIPYLAPEIVLLFKAKHAARDKDAADFARALPLLNVRRRQWLADALRVVQPGHDWIGLVVDL
jgi:hypothetical protein